MHARWLPYLAHLPVVGWLFAGALFGGQLFYFRDISVYYYPNYVFLERSLAEGTWPLWNPTSEAGAPFLMADPLDLSLVGAFGAERALRLGVPLHLVVAMFGASYLAARLEMQSWGIWSAGFFYGLSGYVLSTVNLFELFHATAWAPWVVAAALSFWEAPGRGAVARLAVVSAVQVSTLGAETILQTAVIALALLRGRPNRPRLLGLVSAALLSALLAAPALLGARALVAGTRRAELTKSEAFAWSIRPPVLLDSVLPRFFGNAHTFSDLGFWGQPFFPDGYPYFLSLYVGAGIVLLAMRSGPMPGRKTLWLLLVLGILAALGSHGPLEAALIPLMRHFRIPAKFLFTSNFALCLLAARGLDYSCRVAATTSFLFFIPGGLMCCMGVLLARIPEHVVRVLGAILPEILDPRARFVAASAWPTSLVTTGILIVGFALALRSRTWRPFAGVLVGFDLLLCNGSVNLTTARAFYELRPEVRLMVAKAVAEGPYRWFCYGASDTPGVPWAPQIALRNSDVWLYYMDRQSLLPRNHVLDGLDAAFDEDRVGWAPLGSTLSPAERVPSRYREVHGRLRLANVRWVLSFDPLPADLVRLRAETNLPEIRAPLHLYELEGALPRAFWVADYAVVSDPETFERRSSEPGFDPRAVVFLQAEPPLPRAPSRSDTPTTSSVTYTRLGPHVVRLTVSGPPGFLVVTEGYHADWHVETATGARPLLRANGRYWAIRTDGGDQTFTVRYIPGWRTPALSASAVGAGAALLLLLSGWANRGR